MVIVGCGAGGWGPAQRLARAGWRVAGARRLCRSGPPPTPTGGASRLGSHHLYWTRAAVIAGIRTRLARWARTTRAALRRRLDGPLRGLYTPRFNPGDFAPTQPRLRGCRTVRSTYARPAGRTIRTDGRHRAGTAVAGELAGGRSHGLPLPCRNPVGGNGEVFLRGSRAKRGNHRKVGRWPSSTARFGTVRLHIPRLLPWQGCKVNATASTLVTALFPTHGARR